MKKKGIAFQTLNVRTTDAPAIMYHYTKVENLPEIRKNGLLPNPPGNNVYLTEANWGEVFNLPQKEKRIARLTVNVTHLREQRIVANRREWAEWIALEPIGPEKIIAVELFGYFNLTTLSFDDLSEISKPLSLIEDKESMWFALVTGRCGDKVGANAKEDLSTFMKDLDEVFNNSGRKVSRAT